MLTQKLTQYITNHMRLLRNWLNILQITCAYSEIDFAHSQTSQNLLIAAGLVRNWLDMLQILCAYSDNNCAHSRMSQSLLNSSQKRYNLVIIPLYDLTGAATASEYKYQPVYTLTPQSIEFVLYSLLTLGHLYNSYKSQGVDTSNCLYHP